jgi:hypothetical protein
MLKVVFILMLFVAAAGIAFAARGGDPPASGPTHLEIRAAALTAAATAKAPAR